MSDDLNRVARLANHLRGAIECVPRDALPLGMRSFPTGSCGDSAQLLGAYFTDSGLHGFRYFVGDRGSVDDGTWTSHAWIEREGLVVDITADQFADAPAAVVVALDSEWHRGFVARESGPADFRLWQGGGVVELARLYRRMRPVLFAESGGNPV